MTTDANEGRLISIYTVCHSVFDFYNEMSFHMNLHCLNRYWFWSARLKGLNVKKIGKYSQTSMAQASLGLRKFDRDMDSSSHWGLIMAPGQKAIDDNYDN